MRPKRRAHRPEKLNLRRKRVFPRFRSNATSLNRSGVIRNHSAKKLPCQSSFGSSQIRSCSSGLGPTCGRSLPRSQRKTRKIKIAFARSVAVAPNRRLKFEKRGQHFIGFHNETPGVLSLCSHNPKLSALVIRTRRSGGALQNVSTSSELVKIAGFREISLEVFWRASARDQKLFAPL